MSKFRGLRGILFACCLGVGAIKGADQEPPKELTEYVQLARKAGLTPAQIRENALKAGWPEDLVASAISSRVPTASAPANPPRPARSVETKPGSSQPVGATPDSPAPAGGPASPATPGPRGGVAPTPASPPAPADEVPAVSANPDEYQIGEGDVIGISVFGEPTASVAAAVVRPDGKISVPLLKDVFVAGLTPRQVEKFITEKLAGIIRSPDVTVVVSQTNSKKVYLLGAVKKEGPIPYTYRMTVLQAITEAGGLTDYAKRKKIWVLRNENGKEYKLPFNYDAVIKGEHLELNVPLEPGDQIVVPH